jgi:hypothetical protein
LVVSPKTFLTRAQRHNHFLERCVPGPLAEPLMVHSTCLASKANRLKAVGYGQSQVIRGSAR